MAARTSACVSLSRLAVGSSNNRKWRVPHEGAGEGEALTLTGREPRPAFTQWGFHTVRKPSDDLGQASGIECGCDMRRRSHPAARN